MRQFYKQWAIVCTFMFITIIVLAASDNSYRYFIDYYNHVYHRIYFVAIYLPIFLFGLFGFSDDLLKKEIVIRHQNIRTIMKLAEYQITKYCVVVSLLFCLANIIVTIIFCDCNHLKMSTYYQYLLIAFFMQTVGWTLIGSAFILTKLFVKSNIFSWLITLLLTGVPALYVGHVETISQTEYIYSVYKGMFIIVGNNWIEIVFHMMYFIVLIIIIIQGIYMCLKKMDFVEKKS